MIIAIEKLVWIGNSKWGEYLGYKDYKGLNKIVLPALDKLKNLDIRLILLSLIVLRARPNVK